MSPRERSAPGPSSWCGRRSRCRGGEDLRRQRAAPDATRARITPLIAYALHAGIRQHEIVTATGYTRENIRRIARQIGIEAQ